MKYPKSILVFYLICTLKLVCTILFVYCGFGYLLTSASVPYLFALSFDERLTAFCAISLLALCTIWGISILLSLLGIKFMWARKASLLALMLIGAIDLITSLLAYDWGIKIYFTLYSLAAIAIGIKSIRNVFSPMGDGNTLPPKT